MSKGSPQVRNVRFGTGPEVPRHWHGGRRAVTLFFDNLSLFFPPGERFFARHGGKTVFIGRFVAVLRVTAAWLAGITHMSWWRFFLWNAAGGIVWATGVSLLAYYFGKAAADAVATYGVYALVVIVVGAVIAFVVMRVLKKRLEPS